MPNQGKLAPAAQRIELMHQTTATPRRLVRAHYAVQPVSARRPAQRHQLNDYAAALDGKLIDSDPSFITTQQNAKRGPPVRPAPGTVDLQRGRPAG